MKTFSPAATPSFFTKLKQALTLSNTIQLGMGGVGALAGMLYWEPSATCAKSEVCGLWLSDLTSQDTARATFFVSGASGYSGSNAYFSSFSIPRFIEYIGKQTSSKAKITKGTAIVAVALVGLTPIFIACNSSHSNALVTTLSMVGAFPGALYATVEMAKIEVPYFYSKLSSICSQYSLRKYFSQSEDDMKKQNYRDCYRQHYQAQQKIFLASLRKQLKNITANTDKIVITESEGDPNYATLLKLASNLDAAREPSSLEYYAPAVGKVAGLLITANFSTPMIAATASTLQQQFPDMYEAGPWILSLLISSLNLYGNINVTVPAAQAVLMTLISLVMDQFKQLDSMIFKLRPGFAVTAAIGIGLLSALSYSVIGMMADQYYNAPAKSEVRAGAMFGIDFYHFFALFLFAKLMLTRFTSHPKEQVLLKLEQTVEDLSWQSWEKFADLMDAMSAEEQATLGISEYQGVIEPLTNCSAPLQQVSIFREKIVASEAEFSSTYDAAARPK